jgi:hypothetical protein
VPSLLTVQRKVLTAFSTLGWSEQATPMMGGETQQTSPKK